MTTRRALFYRFAAVMSVLALVGTGAACGGDDGGEGAGGDAIVIGVAAPMTGPLNPWGLYEQRMAVLAVEDINAEGGVLDRQFRLEVCDDKSKPEENGAACAAELLDKGAVALLTPCDYDWSTPSHSVAQSEGVPAIAFCAGAPQFGRQGFGELSFSTGIATPAEAVIGAEFAFKDKGWRTVYLLTDTTIDYDTTYTAGFKKRWLQLNGRVVGEDVFQNQDTSIAAQVRRMQRLSTPPDFLMLSTYPPGGASALRQIRAAGIDWPILSNIAMGGDYWFDAVPELSNFWATNFAEWTGEDPRPKVNELAERYREKFGEPVVFAHAYTGYEAVQMLAAAIETVGSPDDGEKIAEALRTNTVETVLGEHKLHPDFNQSFTQPMTIVEVADKTPKFIDIRTPEIDATTLVER